MDDRGVSMPLQYVLLVATVAILSSGLFVSTGGFVDTQQDTAVRQGLEMVGTRLATDLESADRLASDMTATDTMVLGVDTPTTVAGTHYLVTFEPGRTANETVIWLESADSNVVVSVGVVTDLDVARTTVDGGRLVISAEYDAAADTTNLEVRDA